MMLEIYRHDYIFGDVLVTLLYVIKLTQCKSSNIATCSFLVFFIQWYNKYFREYLLPQSDTDAKSESQTIFYNKIHHINYTSIILLVFIIILTVLLTVSLYY